MTYSKVLAVKRAKEIVKNHANECESRQIDRMVAAFTVDDGWRKTQHMARWEATDYIREAANPQVNQTRVAATK